MEGDPPEVVEAYEQHMLEVSRKTDMRLMGMTVAQSEERPLRFTKVELCSPSGEPTDTLRYAESFEIRIHYAATCAIRKPYFGIGLRKGSNTAHPYSCMMTMLWDGQAPEVLAKRGVVVCSVKTPNLTPGVYSIHASVQKSASGRLGEKHWIQTTNCGSFTIEPGGLRDQFPDISASRLVSGMPGCIVDYSWHVRTS